MLKQQDTVFYSRYFVDEYNILCYHINGLFFMHGLPRSKVFCSGYEYAKNSAKVILCNKHKVTVQKGTCVTEYSYPFDGDTSINALYKKKSSQDLLNPIERLFFYTEYKN